MYIQCNTIVINNMITCSCSHKSLFLDSFIYQCLDINIYIYTVYICLFNFIYLIKGSLAEKLPIYERHPSKVK